MSLIDILEQPITTNVNIMLTRKKPNYLRRSCDLCMQNEIVIGETDYVGSGAVFEITLWFSPKKL